MCSTLHQQQHAKAMKSEINTTQYVFAHGHAPHGRGNWAFTFSRNAEIPDYFFVSELTAMRSMQLSQKQSGAMRQ